MARVLKALAAAAMGALALSAPPATDAHTAVVPDPDEPGLADHIDIEWAAVEHPPSVSGRLVRHTIKTRAPYDPTRIPRLYLRVWAPSDNPSGYRRYMVHGTTMLGPYGEQTAVWRNETPAGDPDTVSYTFNLGQIGLPASYEWRAAILPPLEADLVPDTGWVVHRIVPWSFPGVQG
jgi:hypothetical protein